MKKIFLVLLLTGFSSLSLAGEKKIYFYEVDRDKVRTSEDPIKSEENDSIGKTQIDVIKANVTGQVFGRMTVWTLNPTKNHKLASGFQFLPYCDISSEVATRANVSFKDLADAIKDPNADVTIECEINASTKNKDQHNAHNATASKIKIIK